MEGATGRSTLPHESQENEGDPTHARQEEAPLQAGAARQHRSRPTLPAVSVPSRACASGPDGRSSYSCGPGIRACACGGACSAEKYASSLTPEVSPPPAARHRAAWLGRVHTPARRRQARKGGHDAESLIVSKGSRGCQLPRVWGFAPSRLGPRSIMSLPHPSGGGAAVVQLATFLQPDPREPTMSWSLPREFSTVVEKDVEKPKGNPRWGVCEARNTAFSSRAKVREPRVLGCFRA